ncbi:hypothetical protein BH10ACI1_BH10ACI1_27680 [soil metagenome]
MRNSAFVRYSITFLLLVSLFAPVATLGANFDDGKSYFKEGMKAEATEEWDKAVEQFAMAVLKNPKNPEYRLHLARALFNASQMYMKTGANQANEKDYVGAYTSYRKAYGYDPTNELAKSEMERMIRLQKELINPNDTTTQNNNNDSVRIIQTGLTRQTVPQNFRVSRRLEELTNVIYNDADLVPVIKKLAEDLDLNVLFDNSAGSPNLKGKKLTINLRNVTTAKALDYIFLQEGLFFQRVGPRTILIADQQRRQLYQQLVLRTFYLANANPDDVAKVIQTAIPPQSGRVPSPPLIDKSTNSITIRDTSENIKIIESLIKALDKDRAEVVMDVAIYEVNKTDLLQFGNQVGNQSQLTNLAGVTNGVVTANGSPNVFRTVAGLLIPQTIGVGLLIPSINLSAFQNKNNSKLIASTQIHAFNNEDSSARIGQRVPVQSAQFVTGAGTTNNGGVVSNVIQYEQVGLTLKFKPIVFPNQDVQVAMEIESKDVTGASSLTPTFTERTIKGTARIQNNKTLLLASVAQGVESNGRSGIPLLGMIPLIGRLFTAPTKDNRQVDIVIAVTPRVIRAPAILPEDEVERPTGSVIQPTTANLEAMMIQEEVDEQLALARQNPTNTEIQLPDQKADVPTYVKTNPTTTSSTTTDSTTQTTTENQTTVAQTNTTTNQTQVSSVVQNNLNPIDSTVRTLTLKPTSDTTNTEQQTNSVQTTESNQEAVTTNAPLAQLQMLPTLSEMKKGEKTKIAIMVRSATSFRSAVLGLKFDKDKVAVRAVSFGDVFGKDLAQTAVSPFMNENGKMFVSLSSPKDTAENSSGILAYIEIEALADGKPQIAFDGDILNFLTADGKNFTVKY